jgi:hypothetical protein
MFSHLLVRRLVAPVIIVVLAGPFETVAHARRQRASILEVNLTNPVAMGNNVSAITFTVMNTGIGRMANLGMLPADISVTSPDGLRYQSMKLQAGLNVTFVGMDIVNLQLVPLRGYRAGDNVQFRVRVDRPGGVRIISGMGGMPPMWFDAGNPVVKLNPGPKLPGFEVVLNDAEYIAYNDGDASFSIANLQYAPDITQSEFDAIDLDAVLAQTPALPGIPLAPGGNFSQPDLPDPQPGHLFAAYGMLLDPLYGSVVGSYKHAVVTVPESSSSALALAAITTLIVIAPRRIAVRGGCTTSQRRGVANFGRSPRAQPA